MGGIWDVALRFGGMADDGRKCGIGSCSMNEVEDRNGCLRAVRRDVAQLRWKKLRKCESLHTLCGSAINLSFRRKTDSKSEQRVRKEQSRTRAAERRVSISQTPVRSMTQMVPGSEPPSRLPRATSHTAPHSASVTTVINPRPWRRDASRRTRKLRPTRG